MKKYLRTLGIRSYKLYNISQYQIAKIKTFDNSKYWGPLMATRTPTYCLCKYKLIQLLQRII